MIRDNVPNCNGFSLNDDDWVYKTNRRFSVAVIGNLNFAPVQKFMVMHASIFNSFVQ